VIIQFGGGFAIWEWAYFCRKTVWKWIIPEANFESEIKIVFLK